MIKTLLLSLLLSSTAIAQTFTTLKVGNNAPILSSAALEVQSTTKAFLVPRMTTTQKNAIASPVNGEVVYDTTLGQFSGYQAGTWTGIGSFTIGALDGQSATATGATFTSNTLYLQSADATHPGLVNNTTQTLSGVKTFSSAPNLSSLSASQAVVTDGSKNLTSLAYNASNVASTLVSRDGSGNFSAGTITGALTGTASGNTTYSANNHGLVVSSATNAMSVLAPSSSTTKVLTSGGSSADPSWQDPTGGVTTVGTYDSQSPSANGLVISGSDIFGQSADATHPGMVSTGSQTLAGTKTFSSTISGSVNGNATNITASSNTSLTSLANLSTIGTITSGTWNGTAIAVNKGGTGQTTANAALNALLPTQTSNANKVLTTNGTDSAWSPAGGGTGVNYVGLSSSWVLSSPDDVNAETSVGNWAAFANSASPSPGSLTGGSPTVTCTRTTTAGHILDGVASFEMVKDAANRQGEGCSVLINIPPGYRGAGASIQMPFFIFSGSLASGDLILAAYDVTNSASVPISSPSITSSQVLVGNLVIPATAAQMRIGFYFASTSTTAATSDYDDVITGPPSNVGPVQVVGPQKSDLTFTTDNFGTITNTDWRYRQVGQFMHVTFNFRSGTTIASTAAINLPSGYTIDSSVLSSNTNATPVGMAFRGTTAGSIVSGDGASVIFYDGSTTGKLFFATTMNSNTQYQKNAGTSIIDPANNQLLGGTFVIPISQWSSSVTGFTANQVANSWSGYHSNDCTWSFASATLADPSTDNTCTFTEMDNANFGTVRSYNDGTTGHNLPGIVFTPSRAGRYWVCTQFGAEGTANQGVGFRLWDGTTSINEVGWQTATENGRTFTRCGMYRATSVTPVTISMQLGISAGSYAVDPYSTGSSPPIHPTIQWNIFQMDFSFPAPLITPSYYGQFAHESDCLWSITQNSFAADFSADTSCSFNTYKNSGLGTVTSLNDGTTNHNLPGLTLTFPSNGDWEICAYPMARADDSTTNIGIELIDGAGVVIVQSPVGTNGQSVRAKVPLCGIYTATATSTNLKLRTYSGTGQTAVDASNTTLPAVVWTLKKL